MAGGKGKSTGGKAGPKEVPGKSQKSHSAKAGLQVRDLWLSLSISRVCFWQGSTGYEVLPRVITTHWNYIVCSNMIALQGDLVLFRPLRLTRSGLSQISVTRHSPHSETDTLIHSLTFD